MFSSRFEADLDGELAAFENRTHHQMAVVTAASLNGHSVESYSLALANRLAIGRKGLNDGVMLLVAPNDRKVRIEVGSALENDLTNAEAGQIIQHEILPAFRNGDYQAGVAAGVKSIIKEVS